LGTAVYRYCHAHWAYRQNRPGKKNKIKNIFKKLFYQPTLRPFLSSSFSSYSSLFSRDVIAAMLVYL
jgi:hypothetical protein